MWRQIALTVGVAALLAGCSLSGGSATRSSSETQGRSDGRLVSYETSAVNGYRIALRYPEAWHRYDWQVVSSFTSSMAYLGTDHEHAPCKTTHRKGTTEIACRAPIDRLGRGGVLVTWTGVGFPSPAGHPPLAGVPGKLVRLPSGWLEKVSIAAHGACPGLDATRSITASFARRSPSASGRSFEMQACLRGPNVAAHTRQVLLMLDDTQFVPLPRCATYYAKPQPSTVPGIGRSVHAGALQVTLTPLRQGYPTKVLISSRRPIRSTITLTGVGCNTGTPLRFAFDSTSIPGTRPLSAAELQRDGTPLATVGPAPNAPYKRTGYILFPAPGVYRIDLHQHDRRIATVTVDEPGSAS
jgi:hypothetical protein